MLLWQHGGTDDGSQDARIASSVLNATYMRKSVNTSNVMVSICGSNSGIIVGWKSCMSSMCCIVHPLVGHAAVESLACRSAIAGVW